jgi:hypothetical protein
MLHDRSGSLGQQVKPQYAVSPHDPDKAMTRTSLVLFAVAAIVAAASPAFARPLPDRKTVVRHSPRPNGLEADTLRPRVAAPDSNNPALTGGGSVGYNEMLLRD